MLHPQRTLNLGGRLLTLDCPLVMGILNVTPDSFFDGGRYDRIDDALKQTDRMIREGADIIDIGGMSSRPGARVIPPDEELNRVLPIIKGIRAAYPQIALSVDTVYAATAKATIEAGADLINDISAGTFDQGMYQMVADLGVPYVLMHMQGRPETMQQRPDYEDVVQEVLDFFITQTTFLRKLGVKDIILDPGFGFGKSLDHNYNLLKKMHVFCTLDCPILAGISRKSMINKVLGTRPEDALNGTTALHMVALQQRASILRVHDVREAVQVIKLWSQLQ
jgi:dihydropteroate synthase